MSTGGGGETVLLLLRDLPAGGGGDTVRLLLLDLSVSTGGGGETVLLLLRDLPAGGGGDTVRLLLLRDGPDSSSSLGCTSLGLSLLLSGTSFPCRIIEPKMSNFFWPYSLKSPDVSACLSLRWSL